MTLWSGSFLNRLCVAGENWPEILLDGRLLEVMLLLALSQLASIALWGLVTASLCGADSSNASLGLNHQEVLNCTL